MARRRGSRCPTAPAPRRTRSRASAHGSSSPRMATSARVAVDQRIDPQPFQVRQRTAGAHGPQRRPREVDAHRARAADDVGRRPGPALGEPLAAAAPARPTAPRRPAAARPAPPRAGTTPRRRPADPARPAGRASTCSRAPRVDRPRVSSGVGSRWRRRSSASMKATSSPSSGDAAIGVRSKRSSSTWASSTSPSAATSPAAPSPSRAASRSWACSETARRSVASSLATSRSWTTWVMSTKRTGARTRAAAARACGRLGQQLGRGVGRLEADPGRARRVRPGRSGRRPRPAGIPARAMPVVSRNSPPRSIPATPGVSNTCTHSTRLVSRWRRRGHVTSASRIAAAPADPDRQDRVSEITPHTWTECKGAPGRRWS